MEEIAFETDVYFSKTRKVIERYGDSVVTYAVFMRRPVIVALSMAVEWLQHTVAKNRDQVNVERRFADGAWAGAGEVLFTYTGKFSRLVELETELLQRVGPSCVAAYNAYAMASELPDVAMIAMDARHCAGWEMVELMAFGASIGSARAKEMNNARGFIGSANRSTAKYFGSDRGLGTMPHALIGYAGTTLEAAKRMDHVFPDQPLTVLVDYFGKEIEDALIVAAAFPDRVAKRTLSVRIDTLMGRYVEGLDPATSYAVIEKHAPEAIRGYRSETELQHILGTGVSAAAVWYMRDHLNQRGFNNVEIVVSSGFTPEKCRSFALTKAPVNVIGTGSYLPHNWRETYATADIISYDGVARVKKGREFLIDEAVLPAKDHGSN